MMFQIFASYLTLTNAFASVDGLDKLAFAVPPTFGSYDLQRKVTGPEPIFNLEETCFSSNLQDDSKVVYQVGAISEEVMSCSEAFEMHKSMYSGDVCDFGYPINDERDTLLDRCGATFCSECAQVENSDEDLIYAKEVYGDDWGYMAAPGFEISTEGKKSEVQGMAAPLPEVDFDDAALPSLQVPDVDPVVMPKSMFPPMPAVESETDGLEAPQVQDTPVEGKLDAMEAPLMQETTSMVPPGLESAPKRLSRYNEL